MPLSAGERLGPYEILEPIGKGGMGEVYRARDTRLNRDVAIKVSAERFTERFEREARAIASLNHPNICQLYDVGANYLVMELVPGLTLGERIQDGPVPLDEALAIAQQISAALEAAHEQKITHRDLKPGNIKIKPDGTVKVLDFGLAKLGGTPTVPSDNSPTMSMGQTEAGMILGTAAYMSPEQAKGKPVDPRSDIYAFGVVFYEMLTGQRLHQGETTTEVLASVIKEEPRWDQAPPQVRRLLRRCLEKDPQKRLRHIGDVIALVDEAPAAPLQPLAPLAPPSGRKWLWPAIAAALALVAAGTAWTLWPRPALPARAMRFQVALPESVEFGGQVLVSPDGHKLVFNATGPQSGLWVRDLNTLEWRKLPGTEDASISFFWSPDSRFVGYGAGGDLKKIDVAGGPPQTLCSVPGAAGSGAWSSDGVIVFGNRGSGPLRRISASGGVPTELTAVDTARGEQFHSLPTFLPDGKHFLYLRRGPPDLQGMYVGSLDTKPAEQSRDRILATAFAAQYVDGNLFFMRESTLMAQPFDAAKLQLHGEPVPVAEHVASGLANGVFGISSTVLAYRAGATTLAAFQPLWFDRQGKTTGAFAEPGPDNGLTLSPDAARAAGRDAAMAAPGDIWVLDSARGVRTRLTFRRSAGSFPVWSPDSSRIAFTAGSTPLDTIYEKAASGAGEEKELLKKPGQIMVPTSWSRDGRFLLFNTVNTPKTGQDLWVLPLEGDRKPALLLGTEFNEALGSFSPDGRWIAYLSNESGRPEVYVRPFLASGSSAPALGEGKWQVSKDGAAAFSPKWRGDGKEIVFAAPTPEDSPMAVDVGANGAAFQMGVPKRLFAAPPNNGWDVSTDGKRFLMQVAPGQQNAQTPITVVLNWATDLKRQ